MNNIDFARNSLERYKRTGEESKNIMSEQILDTVDAQLKRVLVEWIDIYSSETDSKVYKELVKLYDAGFFPFESNSEKVND